MLSSFFKKIFVVSFVFVSILFNSDLSHAKNKKGDILAEVGSYEIREKDFLDAINKLHTSDYVGKKLSTGSSSFGKQNYKKYFMEIVERKLIEGEALNLEIDTHEGFLEEYNNILINFSLSHLKEKYITSKINIKEKRVKKYYLEERRKQIKAQEEYGKLHKSDATKVTSKDKEAKSEDIEDKGIKEKLDKDKTDKEIIAEMTLDDWKVISKGFYDMDEALIQEKFFKKIRKKSKVKVNDALLNELSNENAKNNINKEIVAINKEKFTVLDFILSSEELLKNVNNIELKEKKMEEFILHRILDQKARKLGPKKDIEITDSIALSKEKLLIKYFKKLVINTKIKLEDSDIKDFYEKNKNNLFMTDEEINLMVLVTENVKYKNIVVKKLKRNEQFSTLAGKYSILRSGALGGDMGWVQRFQVPGEFWSKLREGEGKKYIGPFEKDDQYYIYKVNGYRKSHPKPYEEVKEEAKKKLGKIQFDELYNVYLEKLKNKVKIVYNKPLLEKFGVDLDEK